MIFVLCIQLSIDVGKKINVLQIKFYYFTQNLNEKHVNKAFFNLIKFLS